jgi:CRISPR-associated protein Csb1
LVPVTGDRIQPAGFPEVGHVIYDAPRRKNGQPEPDEKVCIVDSAASMANHLEKVCWDEISCDLHSDLAGLPYVRIVTDSPQDTEQAATRWAKQNDGTFTLNEADTILVMSTLTEGHRLAGDLFMDAAWSAKAVAEPTEDKKKKRAPAAESPGYTVETGQQLLKSEFGVVAIGDKTFTPPSARNRILDAVCRIDPNSLVHGIFFAAFKDIKIPRVLTGFLEAFGAARVPSSGVKFSPILVEGTYQPIFQRDEETAQRITATFVIDLDQLRSFGRTKVSGNGADKKDKVEGLSERHKKLLLALAIWKVVRLVEGPWRYRTGCDLQLDCIEAEGFADLPALRKLIEGEATAGKANADTAGREPRGEATAEQAKSDHVAAGIQKIIADCSFQEPKKRTVYYPASKLFAPPKKGTAKPAPETEPESTEAEAEPSTPEENETVNTGD